ncbi:unnamed protein product [Prorocentrum cordatum]|uniref:Uncharacterized protein n=1 Tax=Prorocentrum cordatum TaxID=2364126 RepID=A0ABN9SSL1_9DINO|nr:unnamed protein product [Polarella glacialis]
MSRGSSALSFASNWLGGFSAEDEGDSKDLLPEANEQRDQDKQDNFDGLLERLSQAHRGELRVATERLESDKAELERQNMLLRSQVVNQRARLSGDSMTSPIKASSSRSVGALVTHGARASEGQADDPADQAMADINFEHVMPSIPGCHEVLPGSVPERCGPFAREGEDDISEKHGDDVEEEEEHRGFPPRSEYMEDWLYGTATEAIDVARRSQRMWAAPLVMQPHAMSTLTTSLKSTRQSYDAYIACIIASPRSRVRTAWEIIGCVLI